MRRARRRMSHRARAACPGALPLPCAFRRGALWITLHCAAVALILAASARAIASDGSAQEPALADAVRRGGVVVLLRHSRTQPGVGDPVGFRLDDCSTQRSLSDEGRGQARRLGQWFERNRIRPTSVRASPWCRTVETATLAFGGAQTWVALSNLIADRSREADHAREVRAAIEAIPAHAIEVYVSHGVTIDAFVGIYLQQGEMAVMRPTGERGKLELVGRLLVP